MSDVTWMASSTRVMASRRDSTGVTGKTAFDAPMSTYVDMCNIAAPIQRCNDCKSPIASMCTCAADAARAYRAAHPSHSRTRGGNRTRTTVDRARADSVHAGRVARAIEHVRALPIGLVPAYVRELPANVRRDVIAASNAGVL